MKENMKEITIGFAFCGSFCTFSKVLEQLREIAAQGYTILPIMSEISYSTDTRFGSAQYFIDEIKKITGKEIIHSIVQAEPIGPKKLLDLLVIAPCTGNTLGKLACGITDSCVTMAAKAHLRNERPVLIAVSTNDALGASAKNIGMLMNTKHIYFVPMQQDSPFEKQSSMVADFEKLPQAVSLTLQQKQMQPIYLQK